MAMAIPHSAIREYDKVSFAEPVDKFEGTGRWPAGTVGVVVLDHGSHKRSRSKMSWAKRWTRPSSRSRS
jgi:hypothetical protein